MCDLFNKWEKKIEDYCNNNALNFETVKNSPKCWGRNDIWIQHVDETKGKKGLLNENPALVVLKIYEKNNEIEFEQTEYTQKYLAVN